jgi:hypothetical protein
MLNSAGLHSAQRPGGKARQRIGGWLLVYIFALGALRLHEIQLSVGAIVIYADPSIAGLHTFVPLGALVFYEAANAVLVVLTIVAYVLMFRRRRAAITANVVLNALSVSFLVAWWFLGMKSQAGTVIDALPGLACLCYVLVSKRVRSTFCVPLIDSGRAGSRSTTRRTHAIKSRG